MNNVIYLDFDKKNAQMQQEVPESNDLSLAAYLDHLRENGIDEDDILETINAINSYETYINADYEIQQFADGWFSQSND